MPVPAEFILPQALFVEKNAALWYNNGITCKYGGVGLKRNKLLYVLFIVLLCIIFAACGKSQPAPEATPVPTAAPTPQPTPEPTPYISPDADKIKISELMVKNDATLLDSDGEFSDWFELVNTSDSPVSLAGWRVSDGEDKSVWSFPDVTIDAGGYLLVFASSKESAGTELHASFSLSEDETLYLYAPENYLADSAPNVSTMADHSSVRCADGSFEDCIWPTPGYSNDAEGYELFCAAHTATSPLVINEVMVYNDSYNRQPDGEYYDWVELKNISEEPIMLAEYYLSDDKDNPMLWRLPERYLDPGALLVVHCSGNSDLSTSDTVHSNFSLNSTSERLYLTSAAQQRVTDYVWLHDIFKDWTVGRMDGQSGFFYLSSPSPWSGNRGNAYRYISDQPVSLGEDGVYNDVTGVSVELEGSGRIFYTTDGSRPDESSAEYTEPITLDKTTVIRAINVQDGAAPSRAITLSYIINENHTLPVLSLSTDSPSTFSGIYYGKRKYYEIPANISYFEDGSSFNIDCGLKMKGWTSLENPKKSMGVSFRGCYGDDMLDYDIFGSDVTEFSSLSIRAGQDYPLAIIRNELFQELCLEMGDNVPTQNSKYCILYLNGSYYGIYCLKEDFSKQYYASHKGVNKSDVTMLKSPVALSSAVYQEVYQFCRDNDMSLDENYDHICSVLDIDNVVDWFLIEGYTANSDVNGNMRYFKLNDGGKWQIAFYDLDWTFNYASNCFTNITDSNREVQVSQLINRLLTNARFREQLLSRYSELVSTTLSNEHVLAKIDELQALLEPEVQRERDQWGSDVDGWHYRLDELRSFITNNDYANYSANKLCSMLGASAEQKMQYFGIG